MQALDIYYQDIDDHSVMTREEETQLYPFLDEKWARDKIVQCNLKLALKHARKFHGKFPQLDLEDLISEANLGLILAIERFEPSYGYRFSTYAQHWMYQRLYKYRQINSSVVSVPSNHFHTYKKVQAMTLNDMTEEEIVEQLNITTEQLNDIRAHKQECVQFDDTPHLENSQQNLQSSHSDIFGDVEQAMMVKAVEQELERLSAIEQNILNNRYGLNRGKIIPWKVIAAESGQTEGYCKAVRRRSIRTIRERLSSQSMEQTCEQQIHS